MKFSFLNFSNKVIKASYFNAIIVAVKLLSGLVSSKVVAIFLGPIGLALFGNLKNFIQSASSFTAEGYQNGVIRYIAEFSDNEEHKNRITATVFQLSLGVSILIGMILWVFASFWSNFLFQTEDYSYIIKIVGIGLPFFSFNLLIIYILNGLELYKKLVIVSSVLSIINMAVTVLAIVMFGLIGGLISVILGPVFVFIINLFALGKEQKVLNTILRFDLFSFQILKNMNLYLLMAIFAIAISSITFILIRNLIIEKLGTQEAGYWEAMNRISTYYLMFFISMMSFYLLPRLSKTDDFKIFKKELKEFYSISIPLLIISLVLIYYARFFLLKVLLSAEFLPTSDLFFWQLVAGFISIIAIALVKQIQAKLMVTAFIVSNGTLNILYYLFCHYFIDMYGLVGVVRAYALSYFIYFLVVLTFVALYFRNKSIN